MNLQQQSFTSFEIIFVNNGSTDGSDEIASKLAHEYPEKIRLVHEKRKGIPFARNKGLLEAKGEYISFLDIDDRFANDKLERLFNLLQKFPEAAMAYGQTLRIYTATGRKVVQDKGVAESGVNFPPKLAIDWTKSLYRLPQTGSTLTKTSAARKIGGFPESLLLGNDDVGYHLNIAINFPVVFEPFIAVEYFRHEKSEGARLNDFVSVHQRYLDAYSKTVFDIGREYFLKTGDIKLWSWAQRGMFNNMCYVKYRSGSDKMNFIMPPDTFRLYFLLDAIYRFFPYRIAYFFRKVILKIAASVYPVRYAG